MLDGDRERGLLAFGLILVATSCTSGVIGARGSSGADKQGIGGDGPGPGGEPGGDSSVATADPGDPRAPGDNAVPPGRPLDLWAYLATNLQVGANLTSAKSLLTRLKTAGYTKVLYSDSKLEYIDQASSTYLANVAEFKTTADGLWIEIVPIPVSPSGGGGVFVHDPNLIEGQPVVAAHFRVSGPNADIVQNPATTVVNGDFETHSGDTFTSWTQMDGAGLSTFADTGRLGTGTSIRFASFTAGNSSGNDRIMQTLTVEPWQQYDVSLWVKTAGISPVGQLWVHLFSADSEFRALTYLTLPLQATQDWTQFHVIFNSQEKVSVYLYVGIWGGVAGSFWVDDVRIDNVGLTNLVRRPGAPMSVTSADGATTYVEGSDYSPVADPLLGQNGYQGNYDLVHTRPVVAIPAGSRIASGDDLRVSFYHAVFTDDWMKAAVPLEEPAVFDTAKIVMSALEDELHPLGVMVATDEHRVAGWSEPGYSAGKTSGQSLATFQTQIALAAHEVNAAWRLYTWSDMFDPYHNAVGSYYLAHGGMADSASGLSSDWVIFNWNHQQQAESVGFFAGRGHRQVLAGYYDAGPPFDVVSWLDLTKGLPGIEGVMYTTWGQDYSQLEAFAAAVRAWEAANR